MKSKLEIYALAVCFASVVCLVISFGVAGYAFFEITAPEITMNKYQYDKYQTNMAFAESMRSCSKDDAKKPVVQLSEEAQTKQRHDAYSVELKAEKRGGFQTLIRSFMFILVSGIALIIHWKIAQKSRVA